MTLDEAPPNEGTSLLSANATDEAAEDSIHRLGHLSQSARTGDVGDFSRESHSVADMVRTTHNDPDVRDVAEDMSKLVGSTQILYNEMEKVTSEKVNASLRKTAAMNATEGGKRQSFASTMYQHRSQSAVNFLEKVKSSFFEDAKSLAIGTIPQSVVVAITVGLTVVYMGEPGDLPYTVGRVHHFAYIPMDHVLPMVFASLFSILAGGSLGPEAPLVAICGAIGGFVSRKVFRQNHIDVVRKHTLMGMAGALAAFFGAPLGGSIFALEVCSRFGVEYFEHLVEAIFCGEICLVVFRGMSGLTIAPIWDFTSEEYPRIMEIQPTLVLYGAFIGLLGALAAYVFALFHWKVMGYFNSRGLMDNSRAVQRALHGAIFIILCGLIYPQTMFWGEEEIDVVANMAPASELPFIYPTYGLLGFEMDSPWKAFQVGLAKFVAISFTVAGGLRGGFIFPLMLAGASFGRALHPFLPESVPLQVSVLCMAAGINVAITRTALASTLILAFLPGEPFCIPAILMASLCSLFATAYLPFIKTQITRADIDHSLFHEKHIIDAEKKLDDDDH
ncbi:MAG: hypothetical protein SGBAC_002980 [Bacillariaceae sp.]